MTTPQDPTMPEPRQPITDRGTFQTLKEPRSPNRLALDGQWHQISKNYVTVQLIVNGIVLLLLVLAGVAASVLVGEWFVWLPIGAVILVLLITVAILPRQARAIGFQLRQDDIVFRRGILWQRMVAVPYGRLQLVDVTHGPLDRAFHIAQLKMVTAAATTSAALPGLPQETAEELRDLLVEVAESRRTGL